SLNYLGAQKDDIVKIRIFDFAGRIVRDLDAGQLSWDGKTDKGVRAARGTYFARVTISNKAKMVESVVKIAIIN
ncbi:MAG: hypothetical protein FWG20_00785, partial [Candidatus Cloacimonetes bacterium]|nr:hypothetical protein [Candidatus Cloacimonadota bacterium]